MAWRVLALREMNWMVLVWTNPLLLASRMNVKLIITLRHEKINAQGYGMVSKKMLRAKLTLY